jgi:hypothetical protein
MRLANAACHILTRPGTLPAVFRTFVGRLAYEFIHYCKSYNLDPLCILLILRWLLCILWIPFLTHQKNGITNRFEDCSNGLIPKLERNTSISRHLSENNVPQKNDGFIAIFSCNSRKFDKVSRWVCLTMLGSPTPIVPSNNREHEMLNHHFWEPRGFLNHHFWEPSF